MKGEQIEGVIYQKVKEFLQASNKGTTGMGPNFLILDDDTDYHLRRHATLGGGYNHSINEFMGMRIALCRLREGEPPIIEVR